MINGDARVWVDESVDHNLIMTDGTVVVNGENYTINNSTVIIDNDILESQKFTLNQSLSSGSQLKFGSCEANYIEFTVHENLTGLKGKTLKVYMIPDHDASQMIQIGVFKVQDDKLSADRTKRVVKAYDAMYDIINADVASWYKTLLPNKSTTKTMAQFRASFLSHFGITAEPVTLVNDDMIIRRTIDVDAMSGAEMARMICELNGVFGTITNEGKFRFVELSPGIEDGLFPMDILYPSDDLYPQDVNHDVTYIYKQHYIKIQFEDYISQAITQLKIRQDDKDVGVTVGTAGNTYVISDNVLVYGKGASELRTIANNTLDKIEKRYYRPCVINAVGNPLHELGDPIRISTMYRGITTYILERRLTGIQSLKDAYTAKGQETFKEPLNNISNMYKELSSRTLRIEADVDGVSVDLEDLDERESSHYTQTSDAISLKVNKGEVSSEISLESGNVTLRGNRLIVDSTNFSLDSNGQVVIRSEGVLNTTTIENGTISLGDGNYVEALLIDNDGLTFKFNRSTIALMTSRKVEIYSNDPFDDAHSILDPTSLTTKTISAKSGTLNGHAILTEESEISASKISGKINSETGLSASIDSSEGSNNPLIKIGSTYKATTKRYCDNKYEPISSSDKRIKCSIINVEEKYLNLLNNVEVKEFRFKEDEAKLQLGVIAQDVLKLMGDCEIDIDDQAIVGQREAHSSEKEFVGDDKVYTVDYRQFTSLLILAYQQLKREHEELKRKVEYMETARRQDRKILKDILHEKGVI